MIIVVMGVAGSGKSTIGTLLAQRLQWPFYDGDDFHPPANIDKLRQAIPLTDRDRHLWLQALRHLIDTQIAAQQSCVLACSALKASYREQLTPPHSPIEFVYLQGTFTQIQARLAQRPGHFMNPKLLASQFAILEQPPTGIMLDIADPPHQLVQQICTALNLP